MHVPSAGALSACVLPTSKSNSISLLSILSRIAASSSAPPPLAPGINVSFLDRTNCSADRRLPLPLSPPGTWYSPPADDPSGVSWNESDVFQALLADGNLTLKIGRGGQLYSVTNRALLSSNGSAPVELELLPPQFSPDSAWTDDCFVTTLLDPNNLDDDPLLRGYGYNFLQNGYYTKPTMDELLIRPFYEPLLADVFDGNDRSYSVVNLRFTSQPSIHRSDVVQYTKYRSLGMGVVEVTYYFYNFGNNVQSDLSFPWGGVRNSLMPDRIQGLKDDDEQQGRRHGRGYVNVGTDEIGGDVRTWGGWVATAQDGNDTDAFAFGMVHGVDGHFGTEGYEYHAAPQLARIGSDGVSMPRDFSIFASWFQQTPVYPGEGFFCRTYLVTGSLGHVNATAAALVDSVDYGKINVTEAESAETIPLRVANVDGQTILVNEDNGTPPVASAFAEPVDGSQPLLVMREAASGTYVITTDPYAVSSKRTFDNPFNSSDPKYGRYQDRIIYRPYDGRTDFVGMLGYALLANVSHAATRLETNFSMLDSFLSGLDVLFVPGEKYRAEELLIWTGGPYSPPINRPPRFARDPVDRRRPGAFVGKPFNGTIAGEAIDADAEDSVTYRKVLGPAWLEIACDGSLSGIPGLSDKGRNTFSVLTSDGNGGTDVATLLISVGQKTTETNTDSDDEKVEKVDFASPDNEKDALSRLQKELAQTEEERDHLQQMIEIQRKEIAKLHLVAKAGNTCYEELAKEVKQSSKRDSELAALKLSCSGTEEQMDSTSVDAAV